MRLVALPLLALIAVPCSAGAQSNCSLLKSPTARLTCYDKAQAPKQTKGKGSVEGTITWQYNNFVGTKGDVGAKVVLIRKPIDNEVAALPEEARNYLALGMVKQSAKYEGIFGVEVDGFGHFGLDGVSAGTYQAIVLSGKTRPGPDDIFTNACITDVGTVVKDFMMKLNKAYCTTIIVSAGERTTLNHDFGNTYF